MINKMYKIYMVYLRFECETMIETASGTVFEL